MYTVHVKTVQRGWEAPANYPRHPQGAGRVSPSGVHYQRWRLRHGTGQEHCLTL